MVCHSVDGVYRVEGETWALDACVQCLCHLGRVLCEAHQCLPAPCPQPTRHPGQCCARCPEPTTSPSPPHARSCDTHHPHGTAWMEDVCVSCMCMNGHISCFTQQCLNLNCSRPVLAKHQCCPMCLGKCLFSCLWLTSRCLSVCVFACVHACAQMQLSCLCPISDVA
jgi:hypothetical protein